MNLIIISSLNSCSFEFIANTIIMHYVTAGHLISSSFLKHTTPPINCQMTIWRIIQYVTQFVLLYSPVLSARRTFTCTHSHLPASVTTRLRKLLLPWEIHVVFVLSTFNHIFICGSLRAHAYRHMVAKYSISKLVPLP